MLRFFFPVMEHFSTLSRCPYASSANCVEHSIVEMLAKSPVVSSLREMAMSSRTRLHFPGAPEGFLNQRRVSDFLSARATYEYVHPKLARARGAEFQGLSQNRVGEATEVASRVRKCFFDGVGNDIGLRAIRQS